jgi:hypothetical protein
MDECVDVMMMLDWSMDLTLEREGSEKKRQSK